MTEIRLTNYNMASGRLIGGLALATILILLSISVFLDLASADAGMILLAILGLIGAAGFVWIAVNVVISLTIGDQLTFRSPFGSKQYPLTDIDRIVFDIETTYTRIPGNTFPVVLKHRVMYVALASGRVLVLKVTQPESEQVITVVRERGLNKVLQEQIA